MADTTTPTPEQVLAQALHDQYCGRTQHGQDLCGFTVDAARLIRTLRTTGLLINPECLESVVEEWAHRRRPNQHIRCTPDVATHRRTVRCYRTFVYGPWEEVPTNG